MPAQAKSAPVIEDLAGLSIPGNGDAVVMLYPDGTELLRKDYDGSLQNQSMVRDPDLTGDFVGSLSLAGGLFFTPGKKNDNLPFTFIPVENRAMVDLEVDFPTGLVTFDVRGLAPGVEYTLQSTVPQVGGTWAFVGIFTLDDAVEDPPGVFRVTVLDDTMFEKTTQIYRIILNE